MSTCPLSRCSLRFPPLPCLHILRNGFLPNRHGSSKLEAGTRSVLVASLNVTGRDPWQRFVGMWHLWGLFSRSVRYVADRHLPSSGVKTIPEPEPEPKDVRGGDDAAEESPGEDGGKHEF